MPANPPSALPHGARLHGGKYAIGAVLGQGGFAFTYKGGDLGQKRYVAIKEFFPPGSVRQGTNVLSNNDFVFQKAREAFLREATVLAGFHHSSIVRVVETFQENHTAYMVLEFLEGQTLGQRLQVGSLLDEWETIMLGNQIAGALGVIHEAGLLHRDVKPDNIMLTNDGRTVLIDFGTARAFEGESQHMTQVLTPGYAPLEQYAAVAKRGPQTDIYALGATLYHAVSGQQPVAATDRAADIALPELRKLVPNISLHVTETIMTALEMDFERRPRTAAQFMDMLHGRMETRPKTSPSPTGLQVANPQDAESMVLLHQKLHRHTLPVNALAFSPDGTRIVGGGQDRLITVWSVASAGLIALLTGHEQGVTCVAYSPHGNFILSGGQDGSLRLWNPETRQSIGVLRDTNGPVNDVAFCPARPTFVCAGEGGWSLRDANNGQILLQSPGDTSAIAFSPDGALLAVGSANGRLALFSGIDGRPLGALPAHADDVLKLAFSPDGALLATGGTDGFLKVWQVQNGSLLWENQPSILPSTGVSWSPDGRLLASSSRDHLLLWTREGQLAKRYAQHADPITDLAFAPHAAAPYQYIVGTASRDKTINLCRITGRARQ